MGWISRVVSEEHVASAARNFAFSESSFIFMPRPGYNDLRIVFSMRKMSAVPNVVDVESCAA